MSIQEQAVALLEAQQAKVKPRSPQWMVVEQLKDICRQEPRSAELITQDLQVEAMSITEAEKKIKAYADSHKTGNFACVTPVEAEIFCGSFTVSPAQMKSSLPLPPPRLESWLIWRTFCKEAVPRGTD